MKKILRRTKGFEKAFIKLNKKIQEKFIYKLEIFLKNENNKILKKHQLKGDRKNEFSFSITGDFRVIYKKEIVNDQEVIIFTFIDIGKHSSVY